MVNTNELKYCVYTLFSSSRGNSTYIKAGKTEILVDAGISAKAISNSLIEIGTNIANISAIFITHEHIDHVKGLEIISKKYNIPVHVTQQSAKKFICDESYLSKCAVIHTPEFEYNVGSLSISSFITPHDSAMSVGYIIKSSLEDCVHTLGIATDIGYISDNIKSALIGCESVIIESNHDENMLLSGPYPYTLKRRILSKIGHLSNEACAEYLVQLVQDGTQNIMLAHLSDENNLPSIALATSEYALKDYRMDNNISLSVADRKIPTRFI